MKKMLHKLYDFRRLFSVSSDDGDFRCGRNFGKSRAKCSGSSNFTDTSFAKTHYDSSLCAMFYLSCNDNRLLCLCFSRNHYKVYWEKRRAGKMEPYLLGVDFLCVFGWINDYRRASGYSVGFDNCCTAVNRRNVFIDIVSYKNVKGKRRIENI